MVISEIGERDFMLAIMDQMKSIHLITPTGEFTGQGYAPKKLDVKSIDGQYPELVWTFTGGGEPQEIVGWYITNAKNDVLMSSFFKEDPNYNEDEKFIIKNDGDVFKTTPQFSLFTKK